jgi:hypothetical protein
MRKTPSEKKLAEAVGRTNSTEFSEGHPWVTGYDLWRKADAAGEPMPVVADAADCSRLLYWGILTKVVIEGKNTRYSVKDVRKIEGKHVPQELELKSTGKKIAPNFIRPYAICKTPLFLRKLLTI